MTGPPGGPVPAVAGRAPTAPRTYVLRRGRMGPHRRAALSDLWPRFGVDLPAGGGRLDLTAIFGRRARVALEIGFGMGEATVAAARADPDTDLLAVDVHTPGVAALLMGLATGGIDHVRVVEADAREVLARLAPASVDEVRVWFPDPWPKARHHKRRLVTPEFAATVADRLRPRGVAAPRHRPRGVRGADARGRVRRAPAEERARRVRAGAGGPPDDPVRAPRPRPRAPDPRRRRPTQLD